MGLEKNGKIEKIVNAILNIFIGIFSVILLISLYNNVQVKLFGKDYSDFFGYSIFEVQTGSMQPEINPGDWIIVKASQKIKLKDIITYNQDGEYITHRVIGTYNDTFVTKGDANNSKDDPIDKKQVVGKVIKILPNFGIFKKTIFNPFVLVAIIITIMICNFMFKNNKKEKSVKIDIKVKEKITNISENIVNTIKEKQVQKSIAKKEKKETQEKMKQEELENKKQEELQKNVEEEIKIEENEAIDELNEEEFFSYIPVDASELDDTFLEIAENEINEEEPEIQKKKEVIQEEEIVETPTKLNLELLETGKKCKNIIEKVISIKVEELNEIINLLDDDGKTYVNEPTIKNKLMSAYIDSKYYNYYGNIDVSSNKKQSLKIEKYIEEVASIMKSKYKGNDSKYSEKVDRFLSMFEVIVNLEQAKNSITDKKAKEEFYKKELLKYSKISGWNNSKIKNSISEIMKIQRNYVGIIEYLLKKIETNVFEMEFNRLKTNKNTYCVSLEHNITFGKVYSDYIIDKTYNEGVIAENKIIILLNLLSIKIIRNMLNSDFDNKYIVYIPHTLYSKAKKLEKTLKMIEDEFAKESVVILMDLNDLVKYKTSIKKFKKEGYQFALALTCETNLESKNYTTMSLVDYIYVDKNIPNIVKTLSTLPEDVADKLIYEDVTEKIGDFGGE